MLFRWKSVRHVESSSNVENVLQSEKTVVVDGDIVFPVTRSQKSRNPFSGVVIVLST